MEMRPQELISYHFKEPLVKPKQEDGWFSWLVFAVWIIEKFLTLLGNKPHFFFNSVHSLERVMLGK
jgi:hypothetical protein